MTKLNKYNVKEIDEYNAKNTYGGCDGSVWSWIGCAIANVQDALESMVPDNPHHYRHNSAPFM